MNLKIYLFSFFTSTTFINLIASGITMMSCTNARDSG
jgi:hypothetical protein